MRSILFIGAPGAGKTVFFATAVDRFRVRRNHPNNSRRLFSTVRKAIGQYVPPEVKLGPADAKTLDFLDDLLRELKSGRWPAKTVGFQEYQVNASLTRTLTNGQVCIRFLDYAGEVFLSALKDATKPATDGSPEQRLRYELAETDAICMIIDPQSLKSGGASSCERGKLLQMAFLEAIKFSAERKRDLKIAVVFSKSDLYENLPIGRNENLAKLMEELAPWVWGQVEDRQKRLFRVSCVRAVVDPQTGKKVPPRGWTSDSSLGVDEVIWWLFDKTLCGELIDRVAGSIGSTRIPIFGGPAENRQPRSFGLRQASYTKESAKPERITIRFDVRDDD